jgi:hypothetical protein
MPITLDEENNDSLKCVKWETELTKNVYPATKNEKFQLIRSFTSIFHFNVLCRYKEIINPNEGQPVRPNFSYSEGAFQVTFQNYEIELCLQQVDGRNSDSPYKEYSETIPGYYRSPITVWVVVNSGKYYLNKLPDSNDWKSKKILIQIPSKTLFTCKIWIEFNTIGLNEIKALKGLTDYLFFQKANCDIQFCFEDGQHIDSHMNILSARSPVFAAMFSHEMKEARTGQVAIQDIRPEIFKELLHFIHFGRTCDPQNADTARQLFLAADKYDIVDLKHECVRFLPTQIQINNAIEIMIWADHHSVKDIKEAALEVVVANGKAICQAVEWEQLTKNYPDLCLLAVRRMML